MAEMLSMIAKGNYFLDGPFWKKRLHSQNKEQFYQIVTFAKVRINKNKHRRLKM